MFSIILVKIEIRCTSIYLYIYPIFEIIDMKIKIKYTASLNTRDIGFSQMIHFVKITLRKFGIFIASNKCMYPI